MITIATLFLVTSLLLTLAKFLVSKTAADRVIAIDVFGFQLIALALLLAFIDNNSLPLIFAFAVALLGFLSTLILSTLIRTKETEH